MTRVDEVIEYIVRHRQEPPIHMRDVDHADQNDNGFTCAMSWIILMKQDPPAWMRHDPMIRGESGFTCAMWWIIGIKTDPPEWMHHDPTVRDDYGESCALIWTLMIKTFPPCWMWHDDTSVYGRSPKIYKFSIFTRLCVDYATMHPIYLRWLHKMPETPEIPLIPTSLGPDNHGDDEDW